MNKLITGAVMELATLPSHHFVVMMSLDVESIVSHHRLDILVVNFLDSCLEPGIVRQMDKAYKWMNE